MYKKWLNQLKDIELFTGIGIDELDKILHCLQPSIKKYYKNDIIVIEKEEMVGLGIILEGEVEVSKDTLSGDRVIMSRLGKGDIFGEVSAFSTLRWVATVTAYSNCTILFLPSKKIIGICSKVCEGHRRLIQNMLQIVAKKALVLNNKVNILSLKSIRKKICSYLLQQYKINNTLIFNIPLKRQELAEYILVTRPSLSRELINMKDEKIIDYHKNTFKILDLEKLKLYL